MGDSMEVFTWIVGLVLLNLVLSVVWTKIEYAFFWTAEKEIEEQMKLKLLAEKGRVSDYDQRVIDSKIEAMKRKAFKEQGKH
jgi:hypothetical protein